MRAFRAITCAVLCLAAVGVSPARGQSSAETLFIEAQKSLARGDDAGAEALLVAALAKDRTFVSALWQLSQIHESRGNLEAARDALARGLEIDQGASWARERLARLDERLAAAKLAETNNARRLAESRRAARIERLVAEARRALEKSGSDRFDASRIALERVLAEDPENAWAADELTRLEPPSPPPPPIDTTVRSASLPAVDSAAVPAASVEATQDAPARGEGPLRRLLTPVLLAAAIVLLGLDLRRRAARRDHPLQGSTSLVPAIDIVTMLCGNRSTGVLAVERAAMSGEICFEKGRIVHARCEGLTGKKAFQRLMEPAPGRFLFRNHLPTVRRTITEPLSVLLLSTRSPEQAKLGPVERASRRQPAEIAR